MFFLKGDNNIYFHQNMECLYAANYENLQKHDSVRSTCRRLKEEKTDSRITKTNYELRKSITNYELRITKINYELKITNYDLRTVNT